MGRRERKQIPLKKWGAVVNLNIMKDPQRKPNLFTDRQAKLSKGIENDKKLVA